MTVIIGLKDIENGITYIGGDSLRSMGQIVYPLPKHAAKVFETGGFVIGHTGATRIRNLTQSMNLRFGKAGPSPKFDLERELIENLLPAFKNQARKLGFLSDEKGKIPDINGNVLMAVGDQLCHIGTDLSVTPIDGNFYAIGSGQMIALGALEIALNHTNLKPRAAVLESLKASTKFVPTVGGSFTILKTKPLTK